MTFYIKIQSTSSSFFFCCFPFFSAHASYHFWNNKNSSNNNSFTNIIVKCWHEYLIVVSAFFPSVHDLMQHTITKYSMVLKKYYILYIRLSQLFFITPCASFRSLKFYWTLARLIKVEIELSLSFHQPPLYKTRRFRCTQIEREKKNWNDGCFITEYFFQFIYCVYITCSKLGWCGFYFPITTLLIINVYLCKVHKKKRNHTALALKCG